jgi:two-component system cell cycle sensor histidine kinase/response regulator CckA
MPNGGKIQVYGENKIITEKDDLGISPGKYVKISISDEGCGMDTETKNKIFDPYFTTKRKGQGLGLTISYSIIEQHKGTINCHSEHGVGTRFDIYLPASIAEELPEPSKNLEFTIIDGRALIIDDNLSILNIVPKLLSQIGFSEVIVAVDGEEGVEKYQEYFDKNQKIDYCIHDLTIPGRMGGVEARIKMKEINPDNKYGTIHILSSGHFDNNTLSNYSKYGFDGFLFKPFTFEQLKKVLLDTSSKNGYSNLIVS